MKPAAGLGTRGARTREARRPASAAGNAGVCCPLPAAARVCRTGRERPGRGARPRRRPGPARLRGLEAGIRASAGSPPAPGAPERRFLHGRVSGNAQLQPEAPFHVGQVTARFAAAGWPAPGRPAAQIRLAKENRRGCLLAEESPPRPTDALKRTCGCERPPEEGDGKRELRCPDRVSLAHRNALCRPGDRDRNNGSPGGPPGLRLGLGTSIVDTESSRTLHSRWQTQCRN